MPASSQTSTDPPASASAPSLKAPSPERDTPLSGRSSPRLLRAHPASRRLWTRGGTALPSLARRAAIPRRITARRAGGQTAASAILNYSVLA
eukprot:8283174-Alexandrium_andersonii.AAC.1